MKLHNRHTIDPSITATYIGRGTVWGNPFKVSDTCTQKEAADKYRRMLARMLAAKSKTFINMVLDLANVEHIVCSCAPRPCHGECFVEIWDIIRESGIKPLEGIREWVKRNGEYYGPDTDGVDHINAYSKGNTELGKKLTNISNIPVEMPGVGKFRSLEGYWYYLSTGMIHDQFKDMSGFEAKAFGKDKVKLPYSYFNDKIKEAIWRRFEQNPSFKQEFIESELPIVHYYHYGNDDRTVLYPGYDWLYNYINLLREIYKGNKKTCVIAGSRDITDHTLLEQVISDSRFEIDCVISGGANGVDTLGEEWAARNNKPCIRFIPEWDKLGKAAGIHRNCTMGDFCDKGIVIIKNESKGSSQMASYLGKLGKDAYIRNI